MQLSAQIALMPRIAVHAVKWGAGLLIGVATVGCSTAPSSDAPADDSAAHTAVGSDLAHRAMIRMQLAANYLQAGQPQIALGEVDQAVALQPRSVDAHNLRGLVLMGLRDYPAARASFQRALSLQPDEPYTLHNVGWLDCQEGRFDQGIAVLEKVLQVPRYTQTAKTLMAKAMCQRQSGNVEAAEKTFYQAYELDVSNPVIAYHLADLLFRRQDLERARFYVRRLNNGEFANAESLWLGIRVEKAIGDAAAVKQLAEQLQRRFPDSKEWQKYEQGAFSG